MSSNNIGQNRNVSPDLELDLITLQNQDTVIMSSVRDSPDFLQNTSEFDSLRPNPTSDEGVPLDEQKGLIFFARRLQRIFVKHRLIRKRRLGFSVITVFDAESCTNAGLVSFMRNTSAPLAQSILVLKGSKGRRHFFIALVFSIIFGNRILFPRRLSGYAAASNIAAGVAVGEFLVFVDRDVSFEPGWSEHLRTKAAVSDFMYTDSYTWNNKGTERVLQRKPSWSPVRLISEMYVSDLAAVRRSVFLRVGGFRSTLHEGFLHDLALRVSRVSGKFTHVPLPVLSVQNIEMLEGGCEPTYRLNESSIMGVTDHLNFYTPTHSVVRSKENGSYLRARFMERIKPVSVVVPTAFRSNSSGKSHVELMLESLEPFLSKELGDELILVHGPEKSGELNNSSSNYGFSSILQVCDRESFNFSRRSNIGFLVAKHEYVLLVNDDINFSEENPFDSLFGLLGLPDVGLVGGLLLFPDERIQHAGHSFMGGNPIHLNYGEFRGTSSCSYEPIDREVVGVTGALMFQLKSTWEKAGGFTDEFPNNYNDVDYCQKIRSLGLSVIQANSVTAIHQESATRVPSVEQWEQDLLRKRWGGNLSIDKYSSHL